MVAVLVIYAVGLTPSYLFGRWVDMRNGDDWVYPPWAMALFWPALALIAVIIIAILGYMRLDEALRREGV